jgi:transcriptional regulator with GAF, ATPase, and Fis domain
MAVRDARTRTTFVGTQPVKLAFSRYRLEVLDGAEKGQKFSFGERQVSLGSDPDGQVCLTDPMVSRRHASIEVDELGYRLDDLDSKNGTHLDGRRLGSVYLRPGDVFALGRQRVKFELDREEVEIGLSTATQFEGLVGASRAMRELFAMLERVAPSEATVLIEGETGTGKELVAEALHRRSGSRGSLVVFDCSAVAEDLVESELFGHVKGAFTGAERDRLGAFRSAEGGTLFLDEIGELPEVLQPKLLRALEKREVRPLGSDKPVPVHVRVLAATNRSLAREVEAAKFRADLFYRLAVVKVRLPPLRERMEDLPLLVQHFLGPAASSVSFEAMERLRQHGWPGNVRELKNFITRAQAVAQGNLDRAGPIEAVAASTSAMAAVGQANSIAVDVTQPFKTAKDALVNEFERRYWTELLRKCNDNLSEAARLAGIHRKSAEYVVQKLGLRKSES